MVTLDKVQIKRSGLVLFREVSWQFPKASITAIRKTGVLDGSSTLLQCCAGLQAPDRGNVTFDGTDIQKFSNKERFRTLSYCYEYGGLISLFTVYNNLAMPLIYHNIYRDEEVHLKIESVAAELDIEDLLGLEPHQLNDVQIRLVNLMRALVLDSPAIFIDELQAGMSEKMITDVVAVLKRYTQQGSTVIMVTTSGDYDEFADHQLAIINKNLEPRC